MSQPNTVNKKYKRSPGKKRKEKLQKSKRKARISNNNSKKSETPKQRDSQIDQDLKKMLNLLKMKIKRFCLMANNNKKAWAKEIEILHEEIKNL